MDKRRAYAHTMEYDLASQKNRILTQAAAGMGLGDTVLSETSQSRKDSGRVSPLPRGTREGRLTRWDAGTRAGEEGASVCKGDRACLGEATRSGDDGGGGCTTV